MVGLLVVAVPPPAGLQSLVLERACRPGAGRAHGQALQVSCPSVLRLGNAIGEVLQ